MKTSILFNTIICAGAAFAASAYGADTLFDTLGGPNQGTASLYGYPGAAMSFSTGSSAEQLADVQLGMVNNGGGGTVTVDLYATSATLNQYTGLPQPGDLVATVGTFATSAISGDTVVPLSDEPILAPDTMYWIGLSGGGEAAAWIFTTVSGYDDEYQYHDPESFSDSGGEWKMEVQGTPVAANAPDAAGTAAMLGLSLGVLVALRRKLDLIPAVQRA